MRVQKIMMGRGIEKCDASRNANGESVAGRLVGGGDWREGRNARGGGGMDELWGAMMMAAAAGWRDRRRWGKEKPGFPSEERSLEERSDDGADEPGRGREKEKKSRRIWRRG